MSEISREQLQQEISKISLRNNKSCGGGRVECPDGSIEGSAGAAQCIDGKCVCDDANALVIGGVCLCGNGYQWNEREGRCVANGAPSAPPSHEEDPCYGVICTPPMECDGDTGACVCPEGTELINGLCLSGDECSGVLCPPNASCDGGNCVCDDGFVADPKGNCVMAETAGCDPPDDCCPANSTICVQAGTGLGGGGCFKLNQDCDKTIVLWVDDTHDTADDECDEHGMQQICSCTKEIQALTDMITSLTARIAELEATSGNGDNSDITWGDTGLDRPHLPEGEPSTDEPAIDRPSPGEPSVDLRD